MIRDQVDGKVDAVASGLTGVNQELAKDDVSDDDNDDDPMGEKDVDQDAENDEAEADDDEMQAEIDSGLFGWKRDENGVWRKE